MSSDPLSTHRGSIAADEASLAGVIFREFDEDLVGELLRRMTFEGEGFGCYSNFTVREDAIKWSRRQKANWWLWFGYGEDSFDDDFDYAMHGDGYTYEPGEGFKIDVCWFWDGDGVLTFAVHKDGDVLRRLENTDCKKDYGWRDVTDDA